MTQWAMHLSLSSMTHLDKVSDQPRPRDAKPKMKCNAMHDYEV